MENISFLVVFIEGMLSIFSPCILPVIPVYLSILSNSNTEKIENEVGFFKGDLFRNTLFFSIGISVTFIILGSSINLMGSMFNINKDMISFIGGIIIIIMGLFYLEILNIPFLNNNRKFNMKINNVNPFTALLLGITFSFGWTPCIGPMLASVLIMASSAENTMTSSLLIFVYALGFIVPFIIVALFYNRLVKSLSILKNNMGVIKKIGGTILIISGIIMTFNGYSNINKVSMTQKQNNQYVENNSGNSNNSDDDNSNTEDNEVKALDFNLIDQYGEKHNLNQYKGKTIFLNIWATWCPPCKEEMPYIEEIYKEYNKNSDDIVILGVASPNLGREGDSDHIKNFLEENNYTFPVLLDEQAELVLQYGITAFPSTIIIDSNGVIQKYVRGSMNKEKMKYLIESVSKSNGNNNN